jgi:hypothetical protein
VARLGFAALPERDLACTFELVDLRRQELHVSASTQSLSNIRLQGGVQRAFANLQHIARGDALENTLHKIVCAG